MNGIRNCQHECGFREKADATDEQIGLAPAKEIALYGAETWILQTEGLSGEFRDVV